MISNQLRHRIRSGEKIGQTLCSSCKNKLAEYTLNNLGCRKIMCSDCQKEFSNREEVKKLLDKWLEV